ncbi:MAG: lamin tail domain-containing protein [Bacilli bacterium]|nr:lamin tail domain-containing protein [Bacilli bacterium]
MESDFILPAEVGDTTVTWSSDNTEYITITETVRQTTEGFFVYDADVKRPSETVGNVMVLLTATFAYGTETYVKQFSILVKAEFGLTTYNTLLEVHENAVLNDLVTASGFVYSKYAYGYFLKDSSGAFLNIYTSAEDAALVDIGDEVRVTGTFASYHSLYQLTDITEQTILNSGNLAEVEPIVLTDAQDMLDFDPDNTLLNGQRYRITVVPTLLMQDTYENIYLFSEGVRVATIYYGSLAASKLALENYVGYKVTIDVTYYTYYDSGSSTLETGVPEIWVTFEGSDSDIVVDAMTDQEKLAMDTGKLPASYDVTTSLVLPQFTYVDTIDVAISPEISDYLSYGYSSGEFVVVRPETDTSGTLTLTLHYNEEFTTVNIPVLMKAPTVIVPGDDIFISEYIEGSSYNKYIEIYNPLSTTVDLSEYTLETYFNGNSTTPSTMTLSGTLASGEVIVLSHPSATIFTADLTNGSVINFNGNDVIVLKHNGVVVDSIGKLGTSTDFAADVTLVRKSSITGGDTDPTDDYDVSSQWDTYAKDSPTYLGSHTMD